MTVHVDELVSDVQVEPDPAPQKGGEETPWNERERLRGILARLRRDALRTESRGYDD